MTVASETSTAFDSDLACAQCGYNLRMQPSSGNCPECDLPVHESLAPDQLETAPQRWLIKQGAGLWIQFVSYLMSAVAIIGEMYRSYVPELSRGAMMALRVAPLVGLAAVLYVPKFGSANSSTAVLWELQAIAAVIIGGTTLRGGFGRIWGTVVGVIILELIGNILNLQSLISPYLNQAFQGAIIIIAVLLQRSRKTSN